MSASKVERGVTVTVLGESGVGKTCFADRFLTNKHFALYAPWEQNSASQPQFESPKRALEFDSETWNLKVEDVSLTTICARAGPESRLTTVLYDLLSEPLGFVLLYDIADKESYDRVTEQGWHIIQAWRKEKTREGKEFPMGGQRFGCVLVGNKLDVIEKGEKTRQVRKSLADEWAGMHGMRHFEVDTFSQATIDEVMRALVKNIKRAEGMDNDEMERAAYEAETTHKTGLAKSFSKLRDALPSSKSKGKQNAGQPTSIEEPRWHMFFPAGIAATGPPSDSELPLLNKTLPPSAQT
ncbi:P-loop containing nucleoside triphosphate hydrolase protein [Byssothecium circinans]|uniref:P-loop containing nucleoside triphosphate hydrolase protein n=1 Tax=Byssothecium circinans TaxID=147558 RepID=A0A6A5UKZ0_9PLEO|nr:P-loop containing nucleoside triphosphate hydrolase protein [Byssothecium circinans]